ncbi:hypothetical protein Pyn_35523 [Prunus yedoensis var. nudiflora]|uniref:Uncharacterized protein n=1 Tax=Prunus yedoensis var. nudiflora TaxID=2094558 RepID=A0A314U6T2_PRUYE|nr:hypothetical protein Pyn_35523 [Prunus yedoensis var. nudiflora]
MFMAEDNLIVRPVSPIPGVSSFGCFFCYRLCSNQCFPEVAKARTMRIRIHGLVYLNFYWLI